MRSLPSKITVALVSAGLTGALVYGIYSNYDLRPRQQVVELTRKPVGPPADAPREPDPLDPWELTIDPAALAGVSVLESSRPAFPPSAFVRQPVRTQLFGGESQGMLPDQHVHYRYRPDQSQRRTWTEHPDGFWMLRTNSLGLREDDEILLGRPDLRVLIAGDSHTDGVCNNSEAFGNLLETRLRGQYPGRAIETLNAGRGGYAFYHYLGTLERFLYLLPDVLVVGVYGGNDFEGVLSLFHEYNGSKRPPGSQQYGELINLALEIDKAPLAQSFLSYKYFDVHPDQMEVALQAARDVTTEILVTCLRYSVHPIFVYIPGMADVEWDTNAATFEALMAQLELSPEGLRSTDRMADSYLTFLRDRRVDVIDLREVFERAGPGNYWFSDNHINLRGQQLIADELYPLVVAAHPPESVRARRAPVSAGSDESGELVSPGSGVAKKSPAEAGRPAPPALSLLAAPDVQELYGDLPHTVYDPQAGYRYQANLNVPSGQLGLTEAPFQFITNGQGLREDEEPAKGPDLRVVVTGDEHVAGACSNAEALGNLAEAELRRRHPGASIEILNAGVAGYSFQNYLGVLERSLELEPQVFVMVVSNGSDFMESLRVDSHLSGRVFARKLNAYTELLAAGRAISRAAVDQAFDSIKYFRMQRPQGRRAYEVALDTTLEMLRLCEQRGIELIVIMLPSAPDVEWARHAKVFSGVRDALELAPAELETNSLLSAPYLRDIELVGLVPVLLDGPFAESDEPLYRSSDYLITSAAHGLIADLLAERIDALNLLGD